MTTGSKILIFIALAASPGIAHAYIDPGTGSILIQGIVAVIAAIALTLKLYWHRFIAFFRRSKSPTGRMGTEPSGGSEGCPSRKLRRP